MNEKRFTLNLMKKPSEIEMDGKMISKYDVVRLLNEQQSIICKLQDLCGKSDGENAKLRIENKMLEKEVKLLKPTNLEQYEQIQKLQKELNDCEKFRYTVFKRLNESI